METLIEESAVIHKTKELCQIILDQPEVKDLRRRIDAFMADDKARGQYDTLVMKGQALREKQHSGIELTDAEIGDFEKLREGLLANTVARGFMDAQEGMQTLQQTVSKYVSKTFELGHVPEEHELDSGGCCGGGGGGGGGGGCGCSH